MAAKIESGIKQRQTKYIRIGAPKSLPRASSNGVSLVNRWKSNEFCSFSLKTLFKQAMPPPAPRTSACAARTSSRRSIAQRWASLGGDSRFAKRYPTDMESKAQIAATASIFLVRSCDLAIRLSSGFENKLVTLLLRWKCAKTVAQAIPLVLPRRTVERPRSLRLESDLPARDHCLEKRSQRNPLRHATHGFRVLRSTSPVGGNLAPQAALARAAFDRHRSSHRPSCQPVKVCLFRESRGTCKFLVSQRARAR